MTTRSLSLAAAGVCLALAACAAAAQTTATKPVAKPAAKPATTPATKPAGKTLGGNTSGGGKLMTRDELRSCLKRLDDINQAAKQIDQLRPALDGERDALKASGEVLKTERAELDRKLAAVREWEGRVRAHAVAIESFNQRSAAVEGAPRDQRQKLLEELKLDREQLNKTRETLAAEEAALVPAYRDSAKSYNERAIARDAKVTDWNQRNTAAVDNSVAQQEARALWLNECANRPYQEDDEIAIKAGK